MPIVAIATAPGRGAVGIVRVSGARPGAAGRRRCAAARCEPRQATLPGLSWTRRRPAPSTRAWRCTFRRRTPTPAKTCSSCRPMAARCVLQTAAGALPGSRRSRIGPAPGRAGRVHRARLPQRQARPGAGRGRGRPDRCQHRSRRALGRPLAERRVLAARCDALRERIVRAAHAGRGHARLSRGRDRLPAAGRRAGQLRRIAAALDARAGRARARARCCAKASGWCWPASPTWARARCSTRWPAPSWPSSRRSRAPRATASARRSRSKACRCT